MIELDFKNLANFGFIIVGQDGYRNCLQISNKKQYDNLIEFAKNKKYYLYYGIIKDGTVTLPYILDIASTKHKISKKEPEIPNKIVKKPEISPLKKPAKQVFNREDEDIIDQLNKAKDSKEPNTLICPNCGKEMSSSSGYTLHLKKCRK